MRPRHLRAYSLVHMVAMLPLLGAVSTAATLLAARALTVQGHEQRYLEADAVLHDLVRRIQADARRFHAVEVRQAGDAFELVLGTGPETTTYRAGGPRVTRTAPGPAGTPVTFAWTLPGCGVRFQLEPIGRSPGIVWITISRGADVIGRPARSHPLSAAAPVGPGGLP